MSNYAASMWLDRLVGLSVIWPPMQGHNLDSMGRPLSATFSKLTPTHSDMAERALFTRSTYKLTGSHLNIRGTEKDASENIKKNKQSAQPEFSLFLSLSELLPQYSASERNPALLLIWPY